MTVQTSPGPGWTKIPGQAANPQSINKGLAMASRVFNSVNHLDEADAFTRAILEFIAGSGTERGMSQEQQVFAVAVAAVHLRKTFPGGTARFDEVCREAQEHYEKDG